MSAAATAAAMSWPGSRAGGQPLWPDGIESPLIFHSPEIEPFVDELPRLPFLRGDRLDLAATTTTHRFHRDLADSPALGYGGMSYLGPTIERRVDEPLHLQFRNRVATHPFAADIDTTLYGVDQSFRTIPPTVLHLHGGVTPPDSDGNPLHLVFPGQSARHHYPLRQDAGNLWYHDHAMGITRLNVYAGLAGMVLLRDEFDTGEPGNPLGLPTGEFEMPLVLQEKVFTQEGMQSARIIRVIPQGSWEGGGGGDVGVVNGIAWPRLDVARGLYRFRVLNAASFSSLNLFFSNRMRFWAIGNDQGLLDAPVVTESLMLGPGERVDLLVDFSGLAPGETVELRNDLPPPLQASTLGIVTMPLFCRFRADSRRGFTGSVPRRLRGAPGLPPALPPLETPTVFRNLTLSQPLELRIPPAIMALNNLTFDDPDIEMPRQGTVEQWNFINVTSEPHPIHLHLVSFRTMGRTPLRTVAYRLANRQPPLGVKWTPSAEAFLGGAQSPPAAWESGWKDTVQVKGGTVTRIIVRFPTEEELGFDPDAPFSRLPSSAPLDTLAPAQTSANSGDLQGYVWHCHILDHEDNEMMLRYRTVR
ncbi:multicopper oxidase family protein [Nocardia sp. 004]|uniref:multicopper oxidase family protein n=1 Tax=Nocardia sp. 004 TaxID=3385978 RepID=UPI0039A20DF9